MKDTQRKHPANGDAAAVDVHDGGERWREDARCRDLGWRVFFPENEEGPENDEAKSICSECPVEVDCLQYALRTKEDHGVWGGTTPRERRQMRRRRRTRKTA
ncbi:MAG: WhiB family transcriptional regulator [Acidimicrobiia bacterium]